MVLKKSAETDCVDKHEYDINALLYKDEVLYSGADDGKIKVDHDLENN